MQLGRIGWLAQLSSSRLRAGIDQTEWPSESSEGLKVYTTKCFPVKNHSGMVYQVAFLSKARSRQLHDAGSKGHSLRH